jgi:hypothetical protein
MMTIFLYLIITLQCSRYSTLRKNTKQTFILLLVPQEVHVANMLRGALEGIKLYTFDELFRVSKQSFAFFQFKMGQI